MFSIAITILMSVAVGALGFYVIEKFVRDRRLMSLLKILVVLITALAILRILLPPMGLGELL